LICFSFEDCHARHGLFRSIRNSFSLCPPLPRDSCANASTLELAEPTFAFQQIVVVSPVISQCGQEGEEGDGSVTSTSFQSAVRFGDSQTSPISMPNTDLTAAMRAKNDEFTQYHDIEKEINSYLDFNPDVFTGENRSVAVRRSSGVEQFHKVLRSEF
jgi:hypothetical protein